MPRNWDHLCTPTVVLTNGGGRTQTVVWDTTGARVGARRRETHYNAIHSSSRELLRELLR